MAIHYLHDKLINYFSGVYPFFPFKEFKTLEKWLSKELVDA